MGMGVWGYCPHPDKASRANKRQWREWGQLLPPFIILSRFTPTVCGDNSPGQLLPSPDTPVHPHMRGDNPSILPLPEPGRDALMSERKPYLRKVRAVGAMTITAIGR